MMQDEWSAPSLQLLLVLLDSIAHHWSARQDCLAQIFQTVLHKYPSTTAKNKLVTCAIAHSDHLCQAAWLKHGWHHHDVCCCVDQVGQGLVVLELEGSVLPTNLPCQLIEVSL
jgi:hypothetical protein